MSSETISIYKLMTNFQKQSYRASQRCCGLPAGNSVGVIKRTNQILTMTMTNVHQTVLYYRPSKQTMSWKKWVSCLLLRL